MLISYMLMTLGCIDEQNKQGDIEEGEVSQDFDGDGYFVEDDCNDLEATIYPDAQEICDGIDQNCNGEIDEDVLQDFFADSDGDGFGNPEITTQSCSLPNGYVDNGSDCNDTNEDSYPGSEEVCDGIDNDCDEEVDEDVELEFYKDADEDGVGGDSIIMSCELQIGLSQLTGDCDESDPQIHPIAVEICDNIDNDCDEEVDEGLLETYYLDLDEDNYGSNTESITACSQPDGYVDKTGDCNDIDSLIHPTNFEICDEVDNNCDGLIDNDSVDDLIQYVDEDGDGFGTTMNMACTLQEGHALLSGDCDDDNENTYPNAPELCDGEDNDCDEASDEDDAIDEVVWFVDFDGDEFGNGSDTVVSCNQPEGYVSISGDCDEEDIEIHPQAIEICDGIDNNCDGLSDDNDPNVDDDGRSSFYLDEDSDGFGTDGELRFCVQPYNYSSQNGDCDDTDPQISPMIIEICDAIDNDCDELIDDSDDSIDNALRLDFYIDSDGDGFGTGDAVRYCYLPEGYSEVDTDCDDDIFDINPAAIEICDEVDNDCDELVDDDDELVDEGTKNTYFYDLDLDEYGDPENPVLSCTQPEGAVEDNTDCNDIEVEGYAINPEALEICNGIDDDCDSESDANQAGMDEYCPAVDCGEIFNDGATENGLYFIEELDSDGVLGVVYGYCDMVSQSLLCTENEAERTGLTSAGGNVSFVMTSILNMDEGTCDIWAVREQSLGTPFGYHVSENHTTCTALGFLSNADLQYCSYGSSYLNCGFVDDLYYLIQTDCSGCSLNNGHFETYVRMGPMSSATAISSMDGSIHSSCTVVIDADGDGYLPWEQGGDDCNDINADVHVDSSEVCDDIDNNCDGSIDEGFEKEWYLDEDEDGFGVTSELVSTCDTLEGYVLLSGDCDDTETGFEINPDVVEICDDIDNNCDGNIDRDAADYGVLDTCPGIDCQDILEGKPESASDLYQIDLGGSEVFEVQCDMDIDDGGWTIIDIQKYNGWSSYFSSYSQFTSKVAGPSGFASEHSWSDWFQLDDSETEYRQSEDCITVLSSTSSQVYKSTGDFYGCFWYNVNCPMTGDDCNECANPYGTFNDGSCWHLSTGPASDYSQPQGQTFTCSTHWWNTGPSIGTEGIYCVAYR